MTPDRRFAMALAALCLGVLCTAAKTAAPPRPPPVPPEIVGRVMAPEPADPKARVVRIPVIVERGGKEFGPVTNNTSLLPKDKLFPAKGATEMRVVVYGGEVVPLRPGKVWSRENPFVVPDSKILWTLRGFVKFLAQFPDAFDTSGTRPLAMTTPGGTKGSVIAPVAPADLLPNAPQVLTVPPGKVTLPVVWSGGPAMLRVSRQCRVEVQTEPPERPGFGALQVRFTDGDYCIDVWPIDPQRQPDRSAGFSIPVKIVVREVAPLDEESAVLAAAGQLRGPVAGRLQGLFDLRTLSTQSFKAWAVYQQIEGGKYSIATPSRSGTRRK